MSTCTYPNSARVLGFAAEVVEVDDLSPVLESGDSKEGDHRDADAAPVKWVVAAEEHDTDVGEEVEEEQEEEDDVGDGLEARHQAEYDHLELLDLAHKLQDPQEPEQPEEDHVHPGNADPAHHHQPEVEVVPDPLRANPTNKSQGW
jgi:hypothetical protein